MMIDNCICFAFLGVLYGYQWYRISKLEKLVFKQLSDVWDFQHKVVDAIDKIVKEIEAERFARLSNNEQERNISKNSLS